MATFETYHPERVIHLAAQAGVRHSITHPEDYVENNLVGFANILEACRHFGKPHLTYASTSSVYGANTQLPFSEDDPADHPNTSANTTRLFKAVGYQPATAVTVGVKRFVDWYREYYQV